MTRPSRKVLRCSAVLELHAGGHRAWLQCRHASGRVSVDILLQVRAEWNESACRGPACPAGSMAARQRADGGWWLCLAGERVQLLGRKCALHRQHALLTVSVALGGE